MGESGLSPVLELLNCRKKEAFVTGNTALGSETEADCARKQTTKKKVQPQNSLGPQSSASRLFLRDKFPFFGVIPSDRSSGFNSVQNRGLGALPRPSARGHHPAPRLHYLMLAGWGVRGPTGPAPGAGPEIDIFSVRGREKQLEKPVRTSYKLLSP